MIKILFICHGNICRSTMAEYVMKHLVQKAQRTKEFFIDSAATSREEIGNPIHRGTQKKLKEVGIPFDDHRSRQISIDDYEAYDYLIGMDRNNIVAMNQILGEDTEKKMYKLLSFAFSSKDIADPWYTGNFDETYNDVLKGCTSLLEQL